MAGSVVVRELVLRMVQYTGRDSEEGRARTVRDCDTIFPPKLYVATAVTVGFTERRIKSLTRIWKWK